MTHPRSPSETAQAVSRAIRLLDAYGANPARWPADEAASFEAVKDDPRIRAARKEAAALDAVLSAAPEAACAEALKSRILSRVPEGGVGRTLIDAALRRCTHGFGRLAPIGVAAGLSALGFVIGAAGAGASEDDALYYALDTSIVEVADADAFWAEGL